MRERVFVVYGSKYLLDQQLQNKYGQNNVIIIKMDIGNKRSFY